MSRIFEEISDGKLYDRNDMVKVGCEDCKGCSACCRGMGASIILDPYDIHLLSINLHKSFQELLNLFVELNVVDSIILPNLKMMGESEQCSFLDKEGRCSIHAFRPSICRLFPLGRIYEDHSFRYFLQINECKKQNRTKVKVSKWISINESDRNDKFIIEWHYLIKDLRNLVKNSKEDKIANAVNLSTLEMFFLTPYANDRFYDDFFERVNLARNKWNLT